MAKGVAYDESVPSGESRSSNQLQAPLTVRRVAHEIQDELQGAVLLAGVLRSSGPLTPDQAHYFKQLLEALDRTSQLVRRLPAACAVMG